MYIGIVGGAIYFGEIKKNMIRYNSLDVCIIDGF